MTIYSTPYTSNELYHHGIKGQKWGVRRFQNKNGTLTSAGKTRSSSSVVAKRDPIKTQERLERIGAKTEGPSSRDMKRHQDLTDRYGIVGRQVVRDYSHMELKKFLKN